MFQKVEITQIVITNATSSKLLVKVGDRVLISQWPDNSKELIVKKFEIDVEEDVHRQIIVVGINNEKELAINILEVDNAK